jgi:hypothetical protein
VVGAEPGQRHVRRNHDLEAAQARDGLHHLAAILEALAEVGQRLGARLAAPRFVPGEVEHLVDQLEQSLTARMDVIDILRVLRAQRTEGLAAHEFRHAEDRIERRAQVVTDLCQHVIPDAVDVLKLGQRPAQPTFRVPTRHALAVQLFHQARKLAETRRGLVVAAEPNDRHPLAIELAAPTFAPHVQRHTARWKKHQPQRHRCTGGEAEAQYTLQLRRRQTGQLAQRHLRVAPGEPKHLGRRPVRRNDSSRRRHQHERLREGLQGGPGNLAAHRSTGSADRPSASGRVPTR